MLLYLIRHGESHVNLEGWDTLPSLDAGLTDKGHQQAAAFRDWLQAQGAQGDALYSSTMHAPRPRDGRLRQ